MQQHRHQEFIRFLNAVEAAVPAGKVVYAILDNYATHKHQAWFAAGRALPRHETQPGGEAPGALERTDVVAHRAETSEAVIGPMPGTVARRLALASWRA